MLNSTYGVETLWVDSGGTLKTAFFSGMAS
jgi:hypothetical protein